MAHAHNQARGFRLFPRVRLKAAKMADQTRELWNFQELPDVRNTPFPAYLTARSALPDIPLAAGICFGARTEDFWRSPTRRADRVSIASKRSPPQPTKVSWFSVLSVRSAAGGFLAALWRTSRSSRFVRHGRPITSASYLVSDVRYIRQLEVGVFVLTVSGDRSDEDAAVLGKGMNEIQGIWRECGVTVH